MSAYYNEHDKGAAAWLRKLISRGLIAPGDVDERSAEELRELADWLAADDYAAQDRYRAAAYLRACADALDAGPVAWTQQDDEALEPDMQSAWISVQDRMPPDDTPVLVYVPGNEMLAFAIDQWQMQREAPLGWSSATIETGMGWGDHDYEDVSHWMPLTAPGHPLAMPAVPDDALRAENERLIEAIKSLAMPAQAQPLRLPEPMTDEEVAALIAETEYLPTDHAVRYLVETGECRVKEANE